jgi:intracellular multiplication protein IcmO
VSRIDWRDRQNLLEGEAIVMFGGRRIYAKVFYAKLDTSSPTRLNRPIMLSAPHERGGPRRNESSIFWCEPRS